MQIACPACDARYQIPDERLAPGKRVKCARCGQSWAPIDAIPEPEPPPPPPEPLPVAQPLTPAAPPPEPARRLLIAGWAATIIVLLCGVFAAHHFRVRIEHAWPPSERLYNLF